MTTPPRRDGSMRLTSHVDIETDRGGGLLLSGAARELRTSGASARVIGTAQVEARVGSDRTLRKLEVFPDNQGTESLVGRAVGSGFRVAVDAAFSDEPGPPGPLHLLLDDLPVAVLISGYAALYSGKMQIEREHLDAGLLKADICSGWRSDATMLVTLRREGHLPVSLGPPAGALDASDDELAWHEISGLTPGSMRRRRLIDVVAGDPIEVFAMFRDTHLDPDGVEAVLHEYSLTAVLDRAGTAIDQCVARPRVLPWPECPLAADSARRLNGVPLEGVKAVVARELRGTSTCTHLNDLLRSLARVASLLPHLG
ncbi:MAG TPA: DUF2889 domain-containing protein [Acidimicrobiales bacterium]|nr:DUF2889 domain-containing protein [Acidimicrobiales bacterium]